MRILAKDDFLAHLARRPAFGDPAVEERVRLIIEQVRSDGDAALCDLSRRFDGALLDPGRLEVESSEMEAACRQVSGEFMAALGQARDNILAFHRAEPGSSWFTTRPDGSVLGQLVRPIERVGIYVPGGSAPLVSCLLMTALPAQVAGVPLVVVATPPRADGSVDPHLLVAARESGVNRVFRVGGAQAVAALAYGTAQVPRVHKIVGPGNVYVTTAKKLCAGQVGVEGLMGPSEVAVLADGPARADWIAADLLSQAEHDPVAACYLVTTSRTLAEQVLAALGPQLETLPRAGIARRSLEDWGLAVVVESLDEAVALVNEIAPEHLEVLTADPIRLLGRITAAGAIFLGPWSPEPMGDYLAGPSNVLPTGGTARFSSPVSVATFLRQSSVIQLSRDGFTALAGAVQRLAEVEGLEAHARSARIRLPDPAEAPPLP